MPYRQSIVGHNVYIAVLALLQRIWVYDHRNHIGLGRETRRKLGIEFSLKRIVGQPYAYLGFILGYGHRFAVNLPAEITISRLLRRYLTA